MARPPPGVLPGARIIRVRFSNAGPAVASWPRRLDGSPLDYTLIGAARILDGGAARGEPFPVYTVVTSCSPFWLTVFGETRPAVEGDYYLIGRFVSGRGGRRFQAGGNWNGRWHF